MRLFRWISAAALLSCAHKHPAPAPAAPPATPGSAAGAASAPLGETVDRGTFLLTLQGQPAGREEFELFRTADGLALRTSSSLQMGALQMATKGTLRTDPSWRPTGGQLEASLGGRSQKLTLRRVGGTLELVAEAAGKPAQTTREPTPADIFVANGVVAHLLPLCVRARAEAVTLIDFPAVSIRLLPATQRQVGARILTLLAADVAQSQRLELVCEGPRLLAVRQPLAALLATRVGEEAIGKLLEQGEPKKPQLPESLVELERTVEVPAAPGIPPAKLACSLILPKAYAELTKRPRGGALRPLPAFGFFTGSGPEDRDEDTVGPGGLKLAIFKVIAIELGQAGIASLRCDDRGVAKSTGSQEEGSLEVFVADASAIVKALRAERAIDPARVGLVGHSEGAIIGPVVATRDRKLRALVLMAGTGRTLDLVILDQIEQAMRNRGASAAEIEKELARSRERFAAIREGKPLPDDEGRPTLEKMTPWLHSYFVHDPAATARKLKSIAVLIAQGARDVQVSVKDAEILRDAIAKAGNRRLSFRLYPELNHLFAVTKTGSIADYSDPDAKVDAGFLRDVVEFAKKAMR
ncbi:MAG TPA: alpha/beta hydrolase [Polyangia bacterium]|nr:alpha/beta hydrolase [Polyangia bacterium]